MIHDTFLDRIANIIVADYGDSLANITIILPNKRARIFLLDSIKKLVDQPIFSPEIVSIEDFVKGLSGLNQIDGIETLFEFYSVYRALNVENEEQDFATFANWAKLLLQDFNEIDRHLIEPNKILKYLDDIKEIEHWSLESQPKTRIIEDHLKFWKLLPVFYSGLYNHLLGKKKGYQGMIYREAAARITDKNTGLQGRNYILAGFNALNAAEELIFQQLATVYSAKIYWDADASYVNDNMHAAGLFIRKYISNWSFYKSHPFEWIHEEFSQAKRIQIIGTPKLVGQARIAGNIIENIVQEYGTDCLERTAVVLGDENILDPLLFSIPEGVQKMNITMGRPVKNNPAQILVEKLFKLHVNALKRDNYVFYHKDLLDVLSHPLITTNLDCRNLIRLIKENNYLFVPQKKLFELQGSDATCLFSLVFNRWTHEGLFALEQIIGLLDGIKENMSNHEEENKITKAYLHAVFKVLNRIINYAKEYPHINSIQVVFSIYNQIIDLAEVSFEGEPLTGLQVMGVLESRVLDFENVIITSVNEGIFPAGKSDSSMIPFDVRREYGLPTYKEKDAIYTYHFYHLLHRAKNIFLIYNTESEGVNAGEKSRFITQLEIENKPNHSLSHELYSASVPNVVSRLKRIEKSESLMKRLFELAEKGLSPSSLTTYIRNPIDFYFQKILAIREDEEVEEIIAANTLGTIIHEVLKTLYEPLKGCYLSETILEGFFDQIDREVQVQFKRFYKEGEISKGRNLLAFEVAKRHVHNFIKRELAEVNSGKSIKIIDIENSYEKMLIHPELPCPVLIKGTVDRIDQYDGKIRIVDYKTGKVERKNVNSKEWAGLTTDAKNDKIIQVLLYSLMYLEKENQKEVEAGIISFKNLKGGFMPFTHYTNGASSTSIDQSVIECFIFEIVSLLKEIFNPNIPFAEKTIIENQNLRKY